MSRGSARAKPVSRLETVRLLSPPIPPPRGLPRAAAISEEPSTTCPAAPASSSSSSSSLRVLSMSSLDDEEDGSAFSPPNTAVPQTRLRHHVGSSHSSSWAESEGDAELKDHLDHGPAPGGLHDRREGSGDGTFRSEAALEHAGVRRQVNQQKPSPSLPAVMSMQKEYGMSVEELEGRKTVEARVLRKWARWLCRSALASSPTPHWCSDLKAPELPLPEDVKTSVLMALILGQVLPPSMMPPSLVSTLTSIKEKERWNVEKDTSKGEKISSVVRRIIEQALSALRNRVSEKGKTLPNAALVFNGAPVAVMQTLNMCKTFALNRIHGEIDQMLQWYQACMRVVVRRMADALDLTLIEEKEHLSNLLNLQGVMRKDRLPAQLWSAFRNGLAFGCGAFLYLASMQKTNVPRAPKKAGTGVDFLQLFGDPRLVAHLRHNLEHVFQKLNAAGLPLIWTPMAFLTHPDDDDSFLLIQAYILFQSFSRVLPLRRLELSALAKAQKLGDKQQRPGLHRDQPLRRTLTADGEV